MDVDARACATAARRGNGGTSRAEEFHSVGSFRSWSTAKQAFPRRRTLAYRRADGEIQIVLVQRGHAGLGLFHIADVCVFFGSIFASAFEAQC